MEDKTIKTVPLFQVKGLPRDTIKQVKHLRRTMKNRGYAASCRVKRETEISVLKVGT